MKRSFFVKYYSIAFAILPGKAGGLAVELSIPASEVARRFNQDRSAVSRAVQRVGNDAELMPAAIKILEQLQPK